jgi:hypothetical protein
MAMNIAEMVVGRRMDLLRSEGKKKAVNKFVNGFGKKLFGWLNDEEVLQGGDGDSPTVLKA